MGGDIDSPTRPAKPLGSKAYGSIGHLPQSRTGPVALSRAGYRAADAQYEHLKLFHAYVDERADLFLTLLAPGERVVGEWLNLAHGTRYASWMTLFSPFVAFDIFRGGKRILRDEFDRRCRFPIQLQTAFCLYDGPDGFPVKSAMDILGEHGFHGAIDPVEGAVWRVEREGRVDFLAKYVGPDKKDGVYLPNVSGLDPIWNWRSS
jgi:hypothetical protein